MKNDNPHFSTAYSMIKKTIFLSILFSIVLLVSCDKDSDIETKRIFSTDTIYFSCTINNEFLEFKSPSAYPVTEGFGVAGFGESNKYSKDTVLLRVSREFKDTKYLIEFTFSDSLVIDTTKSFFDVLEMKECLFKKGDYSFQFYSIDDYSIERPTPLYIGFNINIYDLQNKKSYTSSIDYYLNREKTNEKINEYNDSMTNSVFQITNSAQPNSTSNDYYLPGFERSNKWFIEGAFKCKLYESGDIGNKIYISDGVLKGCF